ncbi:MAG: 16S rRNA (cytosine(1402)-N(4))-methyltransferase RsmH, partial [Myxococcota bacterium]
MSWSGHATVLKTETVQCLLEPGQGGVFVDGTLGGGGHAQALLEGARSARMAMTLVGIDRDPEALAHARVRLAPWVDEARQLRLCQGNYRDVAALLAAEQLPPAQGLVVDAGVSSHQLDTAERGFSFMRDGPLDMRMGPDGPTAAELLQASSVEALTRILKSYGEVPRPRKMARRLADAAARGELTTTGQLAALCGEPSFRDRIHPATRVFQALRIAVNDELGALEHLVS